MYPSDPVRSVGDPRAKRKARPLNQLLPATEKWVDRLPVEIQPSALVRDYPRIANALAHAWSDGKAFSSYMDSLLLDERGRRRGFPSNIQSELLNLREYFEGHYPSSRAG